MKKISSIVILVVAIIGIAAGIYFFAPWRQTPGTASTVTSSETVLGELKERSSQHLATYEVQASRAAPLVVRTSGKSYDVAVQTSASLAYQKKSEGNGQSKPVIDESVYEAIRSDLSRYFSDNGFTRYDTTMDGSDTYGNGSVVCQVGFALSGIETVSYACVGDDIIAREYDKIEELITAYKSEGEPVPGFAAASRTVYQNENTEGAVLALTPENSSEHATSNQYVFGKTGQSWEFIADISTGVSVGKTNVNETAATALRNEKWGGLFDSLLGDGKNG